MNQYVKLTLQHRAIFTDDLRVLSFKPEEPIDYNPGEYATLGVREGGGLTMRQYSILSHPSEPTIRFFIERVEGGELSPKLFDLDLGDTAWMWNTTLGNLGAVEADFHFIVATVTGISPFMPIVKERAKKDNPEPTLILHGASYPEEFGSFEGRISSIESGYSHSWLTYVQTISRPSESKRWNREVGRVEDVLRKYLDGSGFRAEETAGFAAGHPKMVEKARGIYERAQVGSIHEERYFG